MKIRNAMLLTLATVALASCADDGPGRPPVPWPAAKVVGAPESCIPLNQLRETRIRDDWTIDFIGDGGKVWRNTLTNRCSGLRSNDAITYETSLTQLCSVDIVYILERTPDLHRGPACSLGKFVPVRLEH